jgi:hypothetical protein
MSTIYSWAAEHSADATGQARDYTLVYDTSAGRTKKATIGAVFLGQGPTRVFGFYGEAGVDQGTMTATALTAGKALVKRCSQIQADLETLMGKIDSTGLLAITGL